jgi:hypothetical protein
MLTLEECHLDLAEQRDHDPAAERCLPPVVLYARILGKFDFELNRSFRCKADRDLMSD